MTDVMVPFGDNATDQAVLLLAAAEELGLGAAAVKTTEGGFLVSQEVHDKAFGGSVTEPEPEPQPEEEQPKPAKKAAKRSARKKG